MELSEAFLSNHDIPQLEQEEIDLCEQKMSVKECAAALKQLPNNKSPGSDGFTTNFYNFFWLDIKSLLCNSFSYSYDNMTLSQNQKRSILNLIPK